jgi:hypothetical protein
MREGSLLGLTAGRRDFAKNAQIVKRPPGVGAGLKILNEHWFGKHPRTT